jgi:biotin carboxylase
VEMAVRGAGFHVFTEMLPWVTGVAVVEQLIRLSVGLATDFTVKALRGAVLRFPEARPGRVRAVDGVEQARGVPGIRDLEIYVKAGDIIRPLRSGSDRIGHIIAMADTRAEAAAAVAQAEQLIHVDVDDAVSETMVAH